MSSQPSTTENIRSAAASAANSVSETLQPSEGDSTTKDDSKTKDVHGVIVDKGSFQDQLNQAAQGNLKAPETEETLVEKGVLPSPKYFG